MNWTFEQMRAIHEKKSNILVAAAAGSGKTAVLVERIVNKIIEDKIDIDRILVVTFTNLAASQMKERILDVIYERLEQNPEDINLQRQITLLPKANICTIDSFCLDIVKNNFYELDISPNFRIADEIELKILKQEAIEELFEDKYEENDVDFIKLIENYTSYKSDENLKNIVLKIYNYIQSMPYPEKWLKEQVEKFNIKENIDFSKTEWGKLLFENAKEDIVDGILQLQEVLYIAEEENLDKTKVVLSEDIRKLQKLNNTSNWEELYNSLQELSFDRWSKDKNATEELNEELKKKRDIIKAKIDFIKKENIIYNSQTALDDTIKMYEIMKLIEKLVCDFILVFQKKKKDKNITDFSDIEHFALNILISNGIPSKTAEKYQEKFEEIAIDEYQDSNMIQELILNTISRNNNIFMVGDVKQSIYKFRQAKPELFLEKYETYKIKEIKKENENLKIKLFKNFRSRKEVLDFTNTIFQNIMSKEFGAIEYNEEEYLNLGTLDYKDGENYIPELDIIDINKEEENENDKIENVVLEAKFVAKKIKEMIENKFLVSEKNKGLKPATYKDFAILLRSTKNIANIFEKELTIENIPVFCDATSEYLTSYEIQTIMNLLKIINNPHQDIPQITVLRSMIGGFNENELLEIRRNEKEKSFYNSMIDYCNDNESNQETREKVIQYIKRLDKWREESKYFSLDEFIWHLYLETGFYNYASLMNNGQYRVANLKMLFEKAREYEKTSLKGLYNFINFIDKLQLTSKDMSGAKIIGENENVVRIMSIHKSKGLEFPIVFLSGTGKKFNLMDINQDDILLHDELGIGPKFIDTKLNVKFDTLSKKAISIKIKQEQIEEELRILYVALTRAKEKLIITGIEKDLSKQLQDKEKIIKTYNQSNNKINKNILKKYIRFLDYFELTIKNNELEQIPIKVNIYKPNEIIQELSNKTDNKMDVNKYINNLEITMENEEYIRNKMFWNYEHMISTQINAMSSVSEIKNNYKEDNSNEDIIFEEPQFLKDEIKISGARKGTLIHLVLQKLDVKENYTFDKIDYLIKTLVEKRIITSRESEVIDRKKILKFTQTDIYKELKKAKKVYKEQPFYMYVPAKTICEEEVNENILIQGVIDLYYITEDDRVVLLDYKTDYVENNNGNTLIEKYKMQLNLYKIAIEKSLDKKVSEIYIYSTFLEKSIKIL